MHVHVQRARHRRHLTEWEVAETKVDTRRSPRARGAGYPLKAVTEEA